MGRVKPRLILTALLALASAPARAAGDGMHAARRLIEKARYLHDVEGQVAQAEALLRRALDESDDEAAGGQAHLLLGRIDEAGGRPERAVSHYTQALRARSLHPHEKHFLHGRMLVLNPAAMAPASLARRAPGGVERYFAYKDGDGTAYTLLLSPREAAEGPGRPRPVGTLGRQDPAGEFRPLDYSLRPGEELLDARSGLLLLLKGPERRVHLRSLEDGRITNLPAESKLEAGRIVEPDRRGFVLVWSSRFQFYRGNRLVWDQPLASSGCVWHSLGEDRLDGLLQCPDGRVFQVDPARTAMQAVVGLEDQPFQIVAKGTHLVAKSLDEIQVRTGPAFEQVAWSLPSVLQEKVYLGDSQLYLASQQGVVKAYDQDTGELNWQKDLQARILVPFGDDLFVMTFARTCLSLDSRGRILWSYEYGWDNRVTLLPSVDALAVHFEGGKRVRLDRDLMRLTGNETELPFLEFRRHLSEGRPRQALKEVDRLLELEPGNGTAWKHRHDLLEELGASRPERVHSLVQAARSGRTPNWSSDSPLRELSRVLGARWIWKRQYGPEVHPIIVSSPEYSFYLENDNRTLVLIDNRTGELNGAFHFSEELDMKIAAWKGDTLCVSSPSRLYFLRPGGYPRHAGQYPLEKPVCQSQVLPEGILYSDWHGRMTLLSVSRRTPLWTRKLGANGLLIGLPGVGEDLDVVDLDGRYFAVDARSGKVLWSADLPSGTVTEAYATPGAVFAGYSNGLLVSVDRRSRGIAWTRDFGEQIFSLSGDGRRVLLLTTASKKLVCLNAADGSVLSRRTVDAYLFNRPVPTRSGYWIGITDPALEKRDFQHALQARFALPAVPGSPTVTQDAVLVSTLDNFIICFPAP